jgi:cytochrome c peroxidase
MLRSAWVWRWPSMAWCVWLAGCWSAEPTIDGALTPDQWAHFQSELTLPAIDLCAGLSADTCDARARLGQALFFEPLLSGQIEFQDPSGLGNFRDSGKVACSSCHDPKSDFVDTRSEPNNLSFGVKWTGHNAMPLTNLAYKEVLGAGQPVFTWTGQVASPGDVVTTVAFPNAMNGTTTSLEKAVLKHLPAYLAAFTELARDDTVILDNVALAFDAYERRLISVDSPFDRYVAGDDTALVPSAKRGFALFVGRGTCIECHSGPLFSDLEFHNTGVRQEGPHVPMPDLGRAKVTNDPADLGAFLTPSLRNLTETAPYMHAGQSGSLWEVIDFYRRGGDADGFSGDKDPRLAPLDLTDDDAHDLEDFLDSLTGRPVDPKYQTAIVSW